MQGGIVHGLNAELWGEQNFIAGKAVKKNFNTARMLKSSEMPNVDVAIVESGQQFVGGVGDPGVPPIGPAVANAYFRLPGIRQKTCRSSRMLEVLAAVEIRVNHECKQSSGMNPAQMAHLVLLNISSKRATVWL